MASAGPEPDRHVPPRTGPVASCLVAAALFGASAPASKVLLDGVGPFGLAGLLYLGASLAVLPFAGRGGSQVARRTPRNLARLGGIVLFGGVLGPVLMLAGLERAGAADVSLWLNLETPATAILAWLAFREHLGRRAAVAVVLVTVASSLLAGSEGLALVPAAALLAAACLCWGIDNNLTAVLDGFTPAQSTFVKGLVAGGVNLALGLAVEGQVPGAGTVVGALAVGGLAYGLSLVLYVRAAQLLGASRSQMVFSTAPYFGVLLAWSALGEPIRPAQVVAGALMLVALALLHTERHAHRHGHDAVVHTHWHRHDDGHHAHEHPGRAPGWHTHDHEHEAVVHDHEHGADLHHRHAHGEDGPRRPA